MRSRIEAQIAAQRPPEPAADQLPSPNGASTPAGELLLERMCAGCAMAAASAATGFRSWMQVPCPRLGDAEADAAADDRRDVRRRARLDGRLQRLDGGAGTRRGRRHRGPALALAR